MGSFTPLGATLLGGLFVSSHGDEAAAFFPFTGAHCEVVDVLVATFQAGFQGLPVFKNDACRQRETGEPKGELPLDFGELGEAEVSHIAEDEGADFEHGDGLLADGFILRGGALQGVENNRP